MLSSRCRQALTGISSRGASGREDGNESRYFVRGITCFFLKISSCYLFEFSGITNPYRTHISYVSLRVWMNFSACNACNIFFLGHLRLSSPELDPVLFLSSQVHVLAGCNSKLDSVIKCCCSILLYVAENFFYNHFARTTQRRAFITKDACWEVRCLSVGVVLLLAYSCAGMCLRSRCLSVGLYVVIHCWSRMYRPCLLWNIC
jgi:hypothetical protein